MSSLPMPKEGTGLNTIAFDLDGTLAEPTWPSPIIGEPIRKAVDALLEYRRRGFEIIINTARPASHLPRIEAWLCDHGLDEDVYDIITGKPRAAMYVDDRAVSFPEAFEDGRSLESRVGQCAAPLARGRWTHYCMDRPGHGGDHRFIVGADTVAYR